MTLKYYSLFFILFLVLNIPAVAQVVINEGTNRNYLSASDEDGEYPDWIEVYNTGIDTINLLGYSLTDDLNDPDKWIFPAVEISPGDFKIVFCSGKDRKPVSGFVQVINTGIYNPFVGWNLHEFAVPFYWDGISNLMINTCSYSSAGYTSNSVFNQTVTGFLSTVYSYQDGSEAACYAGYGTPVYLRPNMKLNGFQVGNGTAQNSPYDYPAPYGNWYWGARNQMVILASELSDAGLTEGYITNLAFDVVSTDPNTVYDYIDIYFKLISEGQVSSTFAPVNPNNYLHTNFKIASEGETIYLYSPLQELLSSLFVNCNNLDNSTGKYPDASENIYLFDTGTPSASNNNSSIYSGYLVAPIISIPSGFYETPIEISLANPNLGSTIIYYTLDGSDPTTGSALYQGNPIQVSSSKVLKAIVYTDNFLPSPIAVTTYFFGVDHSTPVLSVVTDETNLYGPLGIFDNWWYDWERAAYVEYFDSTKQLVFSQNAGIQVDGGAGGSRSHPQHSFRVELDDGVLGAEPIDYPLIPNRPERTKYGTFYLRNGSNQYLSFPYKDACQVEAMAAKTQCYYSAWRPVSVYINGSYFGLYELREKMNAEYFDVLDEADPDSIDILSLSYWYGGVLRAVEGNADSFYSSYASFLQLSTSDTSYWSLADQYFDLRWYTDYIIGETWMGNTDWPWNNIRIYRSDKTNFRWRFCLIDLELALLPGGWTDCNLDHIAYMLSQSSSIPYVNIWLKSLQNEQFKNYFINRAADVMNTAYHIDRISALDNSFYTQMFFEMPREYARWGDPNAITQQMMNFHNNHLIFQNQLSQRTQNVRNHLQSNFSLPNQVEVNLNVYPPGAGKIKISTIIPEDYPWEGIYFNGIPVKIEAIANEGFNFLMWYKNDLITDSLNPVFNGYLGTETVDLTAFFTDVITQQQSPIQASNGFRIFPNPVTDKLFIINESDLRVSDISFEITELTGRIVLTGKFTSAKTENSIKAGSLPAGVFNIKIFNSDHVFCLEKFIKINP